MSNTIQGSFGLDVNPLQVSAQKAIAIGARMAQGVTRSLNDVQGKVKELGAGLAGSLGGLASRGLVGLSAAALTAGAGLIYGVKQAYALGDSLDELSARTGIAAGTLLILETAFKANGLAAEDVGGIVNKMQKNLSGVGEEADAANGTLGSLGLTLAQIWALSPGEQFVTLGKAINALPSPTEKTAAAMALFGKSGGKLLALFADSGALGTAAASIGAQAEILNRNAAVFGQITDTLGRAGLKMQGFFVGVGAVLQATILPLLNRFDKTDFAGIGMKFGRGIIAAADAFTGAFHNPEYALNILQNGIIAAALGMGNVLIATFKAGLEFFKNGMAESFAGIGQILLGTMLKAFQEPVAFLQAGIEAALAKLPKSLGGVDERGQAEEARKSALDRMEMIAARQRKLQADADKSGWQPDTSKKYWQLDDERRKIQKEEYEPALNWHAPTMEERQARIMKEGVRFGIRGDEAPRTAEELIQDGKENLLDGIHGALAAAKDFKIEDVLGAGKYVRGAVAQTQMLIPQGRALRQRFLGPPPAAAAPSPPAPISEAARYAAEQARAHMSGEIRQNGAFTAAAFASLSPGGLGSRGGLQAASGLSGGTHSQIAAAQKAAAEKAAKAAAEKDKTTQRSNELLGGIHDYARRTAEAIEEGLL